MIYETVYGFRQSAQKVEKIIGQVQAIDRMVDEDIPCEDVLSQINAAKSALHKVGQVVLEVHIKHCVRDGIEHGDADKTIESFTKAVERFANMNYTSVCENIQAIFLHMGVFFCKYVDNTYLYRYRKEQIHIWKNLKSFLKREA